TLPDRIKDKFPVLKIAFPVSLSEIPCSKVQGTTSKVSEFSAHCGNIDTATGRFSINFPVFFPVSREFEAETGSLSTASSASQT
ncbi:MAG TPA: hypothetical protein VK653_08155, partial [Xanthobacteraceae bacterium]|nr:hypothetical protein [Xanthobacteraceae bacterium]